MTSDMVKPEECRSLKWEWPYRKQRRDWGKKQQHKSTRNVFDYEVHW